MSIKLHIERLVLDGIALAPAQRPLLQAAVEAELARLLAEGGMHAGIGSGIHVPSLRAAPIQMDDAGEPAALGAQIARAVYGSFGAPDSGRASTGEHGR
jgi:hypothetical protein